MLFALNYLLILLIPGYLFSRLIDIRQQILLFSVSISLSCLTIILLVCIRLNLTVDQFYLLLMGLIFSLAGLNLFKKPSDLYVNKLKLLGLIVVFMVTGIYLHFVGFYDELPSDVYIHLERFRQVHDQLQLGLFKQISGFELLNKSTKYWYHIPVLLSNYLQIDFFENLTIFGAINVLLLLGCIYEFSHWLFSSIKNNAQLVATAVLSTLFFSLHFGINVFAFIRYYAIAPTILNFCVYLCCIVCLINYYRYIFGFKKFLTVSLLLVCSAYLLHAQEALFIGTVYISISTILFITKLRPTHLHRLGHSQTTIRQSILVIFPLMVITIAGVYFYASNSMPLTAVNSSKIVSLNDLFGISSEWLVLNPFAQFYRVLTHWGLFISLLYIFYYKRFFTSQPVLLACMLTPLFTVFNPIFIDLFLRIAYADALWRFLYMLPLYSIAARIVCGLLFEKEHRLLKKCFNLIIVALIILLLLPVRFSNIDLPYSRLFTLVPVHDQARPVHWQDMLDFLNHLPDDEIIITDPVSGYMISALTKHHNRRFKFHRHTMRDKYAFEDYSNNPLSKYNGKLLIVNLREGMSTKTAKIARHWNPNNLKLKEFYSQNLLEHLQSQTKHFNLLWQAEDIRIYRITY